MVFPVEAWALGTEPFGKKVLCSSPKVSACPQSCPSHSLGMAKGRRSPEPVCFYSYLFLKWAQEG